MACGRPCIAREAERAKIRRGMAVKRRNGAAASADAPPWRFASPPLSVQPRGLLPLVLAAIGPESSHGSSEGQEGTRKAEHTVQEWSPTVTRAEKRLCSFCCFCSLLRLPIRFLHCRIPTFVSEPQLLAATHRPRRHSRSKQAQQWTLRSSRPWGPLPASVERAPCAGEQHQRGRLQPWRGIPRRRSGLAVSGLSGPQPV